MQCGSYVGVLLYGPSGTGKSTLARCLPAKLGWGSPRRGPAFVELNGAEVFSKFSGDTEANLRATFAKVRQMAVHRKRKGPTMLLIDEFDVLCSGNKDRYLLRFFNILSKYIIAKTQAVKTSRNAIVLKANFC